MTSWSFSRNSKTYILSLKRHRVTKGLLLSSFSTSWFKNLSVINLNVVEVLHMLLKKWLKMIKKILMDMENILKKSKPIILTSIDNIFFHVAFLEQIIPVWKVRRTIINYPWTIVETFKELLRIWLMRLWIGLHKTLYNNL